MKHYAVYKNPSDYPDKFVVRGFTIGQHGPISDETPLIVADELSIVRRALPPGLVYTAPMPDDDPVIYEVWI